MCAFSRRAYMDAKTVGFSVTSDLVKRIDKEVARLQKDMPGVRWNRSTVVRIAIEKYLAGVGSKRAAA